MPPLPTPPAPPVLVSDKTSESQVPAETTWLLLEGEKAQLFKTGSANTSPDLVSDSGQMKSIRVYGHRQSKRNPELTWVLLSAADAGFLTDSSPGSAWKLATGAGKTKTVFVHGYYRQNGTFVHSYSRSAPGSRAGVAGTGGTAVAPGWAGPGAAGPAAGTDSRPPAEGHVPARSGDRSVHTAGTSPGSSPSWGAPPRGRPPAPPAATAAAPGGRPSRPAAALHRCFLSRRRGRVFGGAIEILPPCGGLLAAQVEPDFGVVH